MLSALFKSCKLHYLSHFVCLEFTQFSHPGREMSLYRSSSSLLHCKYLHCGEEGIDGQRALRDVCNVSEQSFTEIDHCGPNKQR